MTATLNDHPLDMRPEQRKRRPPARFAPILQQTTVRVLWRSRGTLREPMFLFLLAAALTSSSAISAKACSWSPGRWFRLTGRLSGDPQRAGACRPAATRRPFARVIRDGAERRSRARPRPGDVICRASEPAG
jgi:hypothetical protein